MQMTLPPIHSVFVTHELVTEAKEKIESRGYVIYASSSVETGVRLSFTTREQFNKMQGIL